MLISSGLFLGFPPSFQSGISSSLPSYAAHSGHSGHSAHSSHSAQQSSIYSDTNSSSFTLPTTTVSTHSSSSAFHKPDDSTSTATASAASIPSASASSSSTPSYGLHQEPSSYNSPSPFSVPTLSTQQQVCLSNQTFFAEFRNFITKKLIATTFFPKIAFKPTENDIIIDSSIQYTSIFFSGNIIFIAITLIQHFVGFNFVNFTINDSGELNC